jgi:hypothetical protein
MSLKVLFLLIFFITGLVSASQSPALTLFYYKGNVTVKDSLSERTVRQEDLAAARQIPPGNNIRITEDSQVVLFTDDGSMISISEPGSYSYDSLLLLKSSREDDLAEYLRFLWQEQIAMHNDQDQAAYDYVTRNNLMAPSSGLPYLMIQPYGWEQLDGDTIRFLWRNAPSDPYTLVIYERIKGGKPVFEHSLNDTSLLFAIDNSGINREVTYYWSVYPSSKPNATRFPFRVMLQESSQQLEAELFALIQGEDPDSGLTWITKASFYDQNKMYSKAGECYKAALRTEPGNSVFTGLHELFLARMEYPDNIPIQY